jgi:hypothetical protein
MSAVRSSDDRSDTERAVGIAELERACERSGDPVRLT